MRKQIPIDRLKVGMYVVGVDRPWLETPFLRHRFHIKDESQILKLHASGILRVDIDTEKGSPNGLEGDIEDQVMQIQQRPDGDSTTPDRQQHPVASLSQWDIYEQELVKAKATYGAAKEVIRDVLHDARMGKDVNTEAVTNVVEEMIDSLHRNRDALVSLTRLKSYDDYTFCHSINVSVLSVALARHEGMDDESLRVLGIGCLVHDIGKVKVPIEILNKKGRLTDEEFKIIKRHPSDGAEMLANTPGIPDEAIIPALEHHEKGDGTGYPHHRHLDQMGRFGRIAHIADIYDAMTTKRIYNQPKDPATAVQELYELGKGGLLDLQHVEQFIQCTGIYPVGSLVELTSGEKGVVISVNHDNLLLPRVLPIRDHNMRPVNNPALFDLSLAEHSREHAITRVLNPADWGLNPGHELDRFQARHAAHLAGANA